ncbi:MAG: hypothetical protein HYX32_07145 [Actinobacteria bacterium]|nr:hypothetical protein [Actinomycetota bacterium]
MSPDELAREVLDAHVPRQAGHKLSFIGIGASGRPEAAGRHHREILRERFAAKTPNDE